MNIDRILLVFTCLLGAAAVILGAFGAHFLADALPIDRLGSFKTGVQYQFYHVFAALMIITLNVRIKSKRLSIVALLFLIGTLLFAGSIYLLSCRDIIGLEHYKWLGPITPIGGLIYIIAWLLASFEFSKRFV